VRIYYRWHTFSWVPSGRSRLARNHEVTLFNRGESNPDLFPQFRNDPWRSRYLQRLGHYDVLVMAIRCSRVFTGRQFSNGRATVLLDRGKIIGVETGHIEVDESWQVTDCPPRLFSQGSSTPMSSCCGQRGGCLGSRPRARR
jgi:hypothetical protein